MDDLYALELPCAVVGVIGLFLPIVAPWILPTYRRPFLTGWAVSSLGFGSLLCIDQVTIQQGSVAAGLGWAAVATGGLAILMPLLWLRIHMWDVIGAISRRRQEDDRNARYRAKDFAE